MPAKSQTWPPNPAYLVRSQGKWVKWSSLPEFCQPNPDYQSPGMLAGSPPPKPKPRKEGTKMKCKGKKGKKGSKKMH
jgi:hypothetical protein